MVLRGAPCLRFRSSDSRKLAYSIWSFTRWALKRISKSREGTNQTKRDLNDGSLMDLLHVVGGWCRRKVWIYKYTIRAESLFQVNLI